MQPQGEPGSAGAEGGPGAIALAGAGALGSECAIDAGCDSAHCVAGRCCDTACDGICEACSTEGRCNSFPADDQRCPVIPCGVPMTTCATYAERQTDNRCESVGVCKTECDPLSVASDTVCGEVAPGITGVCNAEGNCADPRKAFGAACQSDIDCAEGTCVDGVCCREACNGACEACDATGACVAEGAATSCGDGLQCFGRGQCLATNGSDCSVDGDCGSGICEPAAGSGSVCCAQACADGQLCNSDGACVIPESDLGTACTNASDCAGGRCFDGVCCDSECGRPCERCNAPGQAGRCSAEPSGTRDPQCGGNLQCAGRGQCSLSLGAACTLNAECLSGECGPALQGAGEVCCEAVCSNGQRCSADGRCVDAPRPDGSGCTGDTDCFNAHCVAGRCCESACNGVCQACSSLGDCAVSPGNDPSCPRVDCPATTTVCATYPADVTTNLCAAFGSCRDGAQECRPRLAAAGTPCESVGPGVLGQCDGAGNCRDPRVGLGVACTTGTQCVSNSCSQRAGGGTICCDSPCTGVCEACGANGVCALNNNGRCGAGQQCATRTTCQATTAAVGASCANGQPCVAGASCLDGICRGQCVLDAATSRYNECVLAP